MIRLLYLEIIRKDDYKQWNKDPQLCPQPQVSMNTIDVSTPEVIQERFDISHLSEHLTIWEKQLPKVQPFFSFSDVNVMTGNSPKRTLSSTRWTVSPGVASISSRRSQKPIT